MKLKNKNNLCNYEAVSILETKRVVLNVVKNYKTVYYSFQLIPLATFAVYKEHLKCIRKCYPVIIALSNASCIIFILIF